MVLSHVDLQSPSPAHSLTPASELSGRTPTACGGVQSLTQLTPFQEEFLKKDRGADLILGDYIIVDRLGEGGMGVVYKALHLRSNQFVAIKILAPALRGNFVATRRFERELSTLLQLQHPHIVTAFETNLNPDLPYMVMEHLDGCDLMTAVVNRGPVSVPDAVEMMLQAAEALAFLHRQGIVHRDIKPSNLFLDATGCVKVLDLGLAKLVDAVCDSSEGRITQAGLLLGTIDYLAPEQAREPQGATPAADIYSLGCTLFWLLMGTPPYPFQSLLGRLEAHRVSPAPSMRRYRSDIPHRLERLVQTMMAKQPGRRPASMEEVCRLLLASQRVLRPQTRSLVQLSKLGKTPLAEKHQETRLGQVGSTDAPGCGSRLDFESEFRQQAGPLEDVELGFHHCLLVIAVIVSCWALLV